MDELMEFRSKLKMEIEKYPTKKSFCQNYGIPESTLLAVLRDYSDARVSTLASIAEKLSYRLDFKLVKKNR